MSDDVIDVIASNLKQVSYSNRIQLGYYNEPLADPRIIDIIRRLRAAVPAAHIAIFTNGDYLSAASLNDLWEAGVNELSISIHIGNEKYWSDDDVSRRYKEICRRIGVDVPITEFVSEAKIYGSTKWNDVNIIMRHLNYENVGYDRGGSLDVIKNIADRKEPCWSPFKQFFVGFNGEIFPCCNLHPDLPEHARYSVGNLAEYPDIFRAFAGFRLAAWRRSLGVSGPKEMPCKTCTMVYNQTSEITPIDDARMRQYIGIAETILDQIESGKNITLSCYE